MIRFSVNHIPQHYMLRTTLPFNVGFPQNPGRDATAADAFLKDRGIIVRRMEAYGLDNCLRITIGQEDEMRAAVGAIQEFLAP